jgi:hypothetical protein
MSSNFRSSVFKSEKQHFGSSGMSLTRGYPPGEGAGELSLPVLTGTFLAGTVTFMAMMKDSVPEALALGASFADNHAFGLVLAIFIGL